jgi:hypothetical protein
VRKDDHECLPELKSKKAQTILGYIAKASELCKMFDIHPDIDHYAEFFMASVGRDYRGRGLLTELYNRSILLFRQMGIPLCKVFLSSPYTRKACQNKGFTEHVRMYLTEYKDPETGKQYFPNAKPDEIVSMAALRLDQ